MSVPNLFTVAEILERLDRKLAELYFELDRFRLVVDDRRAVIAAARAELTRIAKREQP